MIFSSREWNGQDSFEIMDATDSKIQGSINSTTSRTPSSGICRNDISTESLFALKMCLHGVGNDDELVQVARYILSQLTADLVEQCGSEAVAELVSRTKSLLGYKANGCRRRAGCRASDVADLLQRFEILDLQNLPPKTTEMLENELVEAAESDYKDAAK